MKSSDRLLVVAAHADDEIIGCGGLLAIHEGPIHIIYCTEPGGVRGTGEKLLTTVEKVSESLNCSYSILPFEDQRLDTVNQIECNRYVEAIINEFKPDIVITHSIHDNNTYHQFVHRSVNVAAREIKNLLYFRIPSLGEFPGFDGRISYAILWNLKKNLLRLYDDEMRPYPHPRSYEALKSDYEYYEVGRLQL